MKSTTNPVDIMTCEATLVRPIAGDSHHTVTHKCVLIQGRHKEFEDTEKVCIEHWCACSKTWGTKKEN